VHGTCITIVHGTCITVVHGTCITIVHGTCITIVHGTCITIVHGTCITIVHGTCITIVHGTCITVVHGTCITIIGSQPRQMGQLNRRYRHAVIYRIIACYYVVLYVTYQILMLKQSIPEANGIRTYDPAVYSSTLYTLHIPG